MKSRTRVISAIVFCIYIAAVLLLCIMKPDTLPQTSFMLFGIEADKLAHFLMFLPFPILSYAAFAGEWKPSWKHLLLLVGLMSAGVASAMGTELIQTLLEYRSGDYDDFAADMIGMAAGGIITIVYILSNKRQSR
jgi:VanZ family protein